MASRSYKFKRKNREGIFDKASFSDQQSSLCKVHKEVQMYKNYFRSQDYYENLKKVPTTFTEYDITST